MSQQLDRHQDQEEPFDHRPTPPLEAYEREAEEAAPFDDAETEEAESALRRMEAQRSAERSALFERLNERQAQAVNMPHRSALVLAAAGSGKTSVLTARIARLLTAGHPSIPARSILAVTFTNKAAQEMRQRLLKLLDRRSVNELWIGTFHSLCNRLLRENAEAANLPKTFAILDVDAQEALCRGILKDLGLTRSVVKQKQRSEEARAQGDLLAPEARRLAAAGAITAEDAGAPDGGDSGEYLTPAQCAKYIAARKETAKAPRPPVQAVSPRSSDIEQLESVYAEYQARCHRASLLDFQDLLTRAVKLLEDSAAARDKMRDRFQAILVDEFQDTNDIQYRWLELIKGHHAHVMAVGDDDQSIYAFRGARPENMAVFLDGMAKASDGSPGSLIRLEQNYRSLPHILEAANAVISRNTNRLGKTLCTDQPDAGQKIDMVRYGNGVFEAVSVARSIHRLVKHDGVPPSEIAILYRANQQSRLFEAELNKLGLPLTVYGGFRFYERQEVKYVLAYLALINDLGHDVSFAKVANFPPRGLGERTLEELRQDAQLRRISMMEMVIQRTAWREASPASIGNTAAVKKQVLLEGFADLIFDLAERAQTLPLHKLIEATIDDSGLAAHYAAEAAEAGGGASSDTNERLANVAELVSAARQFVLDNPDVEPHDTLGQLTEYLAHVALMTSTSESDMSAKNTISLMTVHSSKGLEFDHVFITGLEERVFPHARAMEEDAAWMPRAGAGRLKALREQTRGSDTAPGEHEDGPAIQEERRLMYVALTRARKAANLSRCSERLINGEVRKFEASRFIDELPEQRLRHRDDAAQRGFGPDRRQRHVAPDVPAARCLAIIGTAGRDKARASSMNSVMWEAMLLDAQERVQLGDTLVSGGAAWADHLAVRLFLDGRAAALSLHLPAPLGPAGRFEGPGIELGGSSGAAANHYHDLFRKATGIDGLKEIALAIQRGARVTSEPAMRGYMAMNVRNKKVAAQCNVMLAYTWGAGDAPADGGTKQAWDMARDVRRVHVPLTELLLGTVPDEVQCQSNDRPRMRA